LIKSKSFNIKLNNAIGMSGREDAKEAENIQPIQPSSHKSNSTAVFDLDVVKKKMWDV